MKKSRKPRVQFPPGVNLRQDIPSKPQNPINQKQSTMKFFKRMLSPDLPPGFESTNFATTQKPQLIPQITWRCPPMISLSQRWLVAAGNESTETQTQNQREVKVFEAVYPHHSAIPSCPSVSPDVEAAQYDDSKTPAVRLVPIEDDNAENKLSQSESRAMSETPVGGNPAAETISDPGTDLNSAASVALTALIKGKGHEGMIDADLLFRILKQPKMVQSLMEGKTPKPSGKEISPLDAKIAPVFASVQPPKSVSLPYPNPNLNSMTPVSAYHQLIREETVGKPSFESSSGYGRRTNPLSMMMPQLNGNLDSVRASTVLNPVEPPKRGFTLPMNFINPVQPSAAPNLVQICKPGVQNLTRNVIPVRVSSGLKPNRQVKDINYFKNLIREHGSVKQETEADENNPFNSETRHQFVGFEQKPNSKPVGVKGKSRKRCKYFRSSRGCQLGADCMYLHDLPNQRSQTGGKKMKL